MNIPKTVKVNIRLSGDEAEALESLLGDLSASLHKKHGLSDEQSKMISALYSKLTEVVWPEPE